SLAGTLYVVATPIGNLEDITLRALRILKEADAIACEDTRRARKLLAHYKIGAKRLISYYEGNERERVDELLEILRGGKDIALVSDSGTPCISDPGYRITRAAAAAGMSVVPVPGPSAAIAALSASGLPSDRFVFEGFLPRKRSHFKKRVSELSDEIRTIVLYESVHRISETLSELAEAFGEREAVVFRELTKSHEEALRGSLSDLAKRDFPRKGEFVVIIRGAK
ncbi:MAG: 16S rRNA (cytidine(1402)-2'-O)-methyltransferase, partial [candidate division WOR-3 bacterium]